MVENFQENFKGEAENLICKECLTHKDNQDEVKNCEYIKKKVKKLHKINEAYSSNVSE